MYVELHVNVSLCGQAVLNTYLLEGVPLVAKHSIFFYLLCDLMYLTPEETTEKVSL